MAEIMLVGLKDVYIQKHLDGRLYGLDVECIELQNIAVLPPEAELESMHAPAVVLLNADADSTFRDIELIRRHWHFAATIVCAEHARMTRVHQLLAKGAHDFLELPLNPDEFVKRVCARVGAYRYRSHESTRQLGRLTINMMQRTVSNGSETAFLTPIETRIVATLADSVGNVIERSAMKRMCWGDMSITDNALNRKIYEVRRTLRKLSEEINIRTIYGLGFELEVADKSRAT